MSDGEANADIESDKEKLAKTVEALRGRFGPRAIHLRAKGAQDGITRLPTGFPELDAALGGGLPRGRLTEITGRPTAGTVTLALKAVTQAQAQEEAAVYLDLKRTFDADYAARCGVDLDNLLLVRPYDAGQAFALLRDFADSGCGVLVCDLLPALADARLAQVLGQLLLPLAQSATALLCLLSLPSRQERSLQDASLSYYAALRLQLRRERWLHRGKEIRGYRAQALIAKNKLGPAGQQATIEITFNGVVQGNHPREGSV